MGDMPCSESLERNADSPANSAAPAYCHGAHTYPCPTWGPGLCLRHPSLHPCIPSSITVSLPPSLPPSLHPFMPPSLHPSLHPCILSSLRPCIPASLPPFPHPSLHPRIPSSITAPLHPSIPPSLPASLPPSLHPSLHPSTVRVQGGGHDTTPAPTSGGPGCSSCPALPSSQGVCTGASCPAARW